MGTADARLHRAELEIRVVACTLSHARGTRSSMLIEGSRFMSYRGQRLYPSDGAADEFGIRWFLPAVMRHRQVLIHTLFASIFVQLCALTAPLLFQVVIDKVLVHYSVPTLVIATIGLIVIGLFEVWLQYLRSYVLFHAASRIDMELGRRIFAHLLRLPLSYFETQTTGAIVSRLRELETIRAFLTGQSVTSVMDMLLAVVFVPVLVAYSPQLTLIIAAAFTIHIAVAGSMRSRLRDKIQQKFTAGVRNQQFLVESVVGMRTLKAASVEASLQGEWDGKLARFINIACRANVLDAIRQCIIQYIGKLTTALILLCGARLVMAGEMTIGSLVAFNMLAELISVPLLRLAALWQDFQQTQVSVARLGDILRQQCESLPAAPVGVPPLRGDISIRQVVFRYKDDGREILKGVSLEIPAGQVLGIVGPSGSGKSTLTKVLQRLYLPQGGQIAVDGMDIADMHPHWLRQQIGTVLQENLLFKRTVHDNIALAAPYITREQVVAAARMAGADEFISRLPQGYDTPVEERGSNFSGGERQRIAIARALTRDPRILILDEATSAVDYISEQIIQNNLKEIARGRTVIIIAHRLAAVRGCDRIISLVDGEIVEDGAHDDLIRREGGLYRHLWTLQSAV